MFFRAKVFPGPGPLGLRVFLSKWWNLSKVKPEEVIPAETLQFLWERRRASLRTLFYLPIDWLVCFREHETEEAYWDAVAELEAAAVEPPVSGRSFMAFRTSAKVPKVRESFQSWPAVQLGSYFDMKTNTFTVVDHWDDEENPEDPAQPPPYRLRVLIQLTEGYDDRGTFPTRIMHLPPGLTVNRAAYSPKPLHDLVYLDWE
ncbi:hypothetical protein N7532_001856 [Penicillium argentinense]|uniref:Uncharacterized protein n=1 Tax=Penicillium argentinense TaxID=1131581 RepID=A0A9W9G3J5_9EURO|nr:uncharacterized protein N7532_001856 [Penicillium argentinense]KAJ5111321.1 hypothetical protein N7532_001856 [Penicillium argentinense]